MRPARKFFLRAIHPFFLWIGIFQGLVASCEESAPVTGMGPLAAIFVAVFGIMILPRLAEFLCQLSVVTGIFKPPWESPRNATKLNLLSAIQIGCIWCIGLATGITLSVPWQGVRAAYVALDAYALALALHLTLVRLTKRFSPARKDENDATGAATHQNN